MWGLRGNHEVSSPIRKRDVLKLLRGPLTLSRGDSPGALNRNAIHKYIINPTSTDVWFPPAKNAKGQLGLARECSMKVRE